MFEESSKKSFSLDLWTGEDLAVSVVLRLIADFPFDVLEISEDPFFGFWRQIC
jgi:hypothetical protein